MTRSEEALNLVRRLVVSNTEGRIDGHAISAGQNLYELGIDSLASVSLLVALAEATETDLEDVIDTLETPRSVSELVSIAQQFLEQKTVSL